GIDHYPVLQIINPKFSRLPESDRTEMSGDLRATFVRGRNRGGQLRSSNKVVDLEVIDTFIKPVIDCASGILWTSQLMQLQCPRTFAFNVRTGDMDFRPGHVAGINRLLDFEIRVGF